MEVARNIPTRDNNGRVIELRIIAENESDIELFKKVSFDNPEPYTPTEEELDRLIYLQRKSKHSNE